MLDFDQALGSVWGEDAQNGVGHDPGLCLWGKRDVYLVQYFIQHFMP